ncbi:hypothetical protein [Streptomyces hygroscopicus]|uniref:hypothetical protein n=1 Tax=Streptomyces hygroscopicus TaxID=1912 RepID=UPI0022406474|nr:hypothetical protein [Streptomyces hygroscopicus]
MDEPRDQPAPAESRLHPLAAAASLTPIQQAYGRYVGHALTCDACRDIDRSCDKAELLWRAYQAHGEQAYRRLDGETA